ncbi:MAG: PilZ domain-containing protein [Desulfomonilia bacterium]
MESRGHLADKRRARRYPMMLEIVYKAQGDDTSMPGYVINISESGMFLITRKPYAKGRYISANLSGKNPGEFFMARGRVVRATPAAWRLISLTGTEHQRPRAQAGEKALLPCNGLTLGCTPPGPGTAG